MAFLARFLFALLGHIHESLKAVFKDDISLFMHVHGHAETDFVCVWLMQKHPVDQCVRAED